MDRPGEKLRRARERLKLTYRDVEYASREIAARRGSADFHSMAKPLPSLFRLQKNFPGDGLDRYCPV